MYPWVVQLTFSWSCLMQKDFHDNEMRKLILCSRNPQDWTAQALKRAYTGLNHTGSQASIYVYIYTEENVQTPSLYILFLILPPTFPYFLLLSNLLSHKLIQFIQHSQPSFYLAYVLFFLEVWKLYIYIYIYIKNSTTNCMAYR